jgi:DNA-binding MurR/RpiR family transcriptional regulator
MTTIALTDNAASPLSNLAQHTLLVDCEGVTILRSLTAFVSLVQALSTAVALHLGTQSRSELITDEQMLADLHVYTDEAGASDLH